MIKRKFGKKAYAINDSNIVIFLILLLFVTSDSQ